MRGLLSGLEKVLGSGLGTGYLPLAPGTWASLLAAGIYWVLLPQSPYLYIAIVLTLFFLGVGIATRLEKEWGHDSRKIVIDEFVGLFVTMAFLPKSLPLLLVGFFLFRLCDITEPFPIAHSERLPRGWGVMIDDLLAGLYANIGLHIILFIPRIARLV